MAFAHLVAVGRIHANGLEYFGIVEDWSTKRRNLQVKLVDLPVLVDAWKGRKQEPDPRNPRFTLVDLVPDMRLADACESTAHALYAMAELASKFGHLLTRKMRDKELPSRFNSLRQRAEGGDIDPALKAALGDLQWYRKVRELRTEWTHHSTIFVGGTPAGEPLFVASDHRDPKDRVEFKERAHFSAEEIMTWVRNAIMTLDGFADYLLPIAISKLDLTAVITVPIRDERGFPVLVPGDKFQSEKITLGEELRRWGVPLAMSASSETGKAP